MPKRLYLLTRDFHLYAGLFISPFVALFAFSVFLLVHPTSSAISTWAGQPTRTVRNLEIPLNVESLSGRARVDAVRTLLDYANLHGEVGFIRHLPKERRLSIPVNVPGRETMFDIDISTRTAVITSRDTGVLDAVIMLHKAPGPHLADIRMNWLPMRLWRWLADATVYLLLLISASGIYLWIALRSERRVGIAMLVAGAVSFCGTVYALAR